MIIKELSEGPLKDRIVVTESAPMKTKFSLQFYPSTNQMQVCALSTRSIAPSVGSYATFCAAPGCHSRKIHDRILCTRPRDPDENRCPVALRTAPSRSPCLSASADPRILPLTGPPRSFRLLLADPHAFSAICEFFDLCPRACARIRDLRVAPRQDEE